MKIRFLNPYFTLPSVLRRLACNRLILKTMLILAVAATFYLTIELRRTEAFDTGRLEASAGYAANATDDAINDLVLAMSALERDIRSADCVSPVCLDEQLRLLRLAHPHLASAMVTDVKGIVLSVTTSGDKTLSQPWPGFSIQDQSFFRLVKDHSQVYVSAAPRQYAHKGDRAFVVVVKRHNELGAFSGVIQSIVGGQHLANVARPDWMGVKQEVSLKLFDQQYQLLIDSRTEDLAGEQAYENALTTQLKAGKFKGKYSDHLGITYRYRAQELPRFPWIMVAQIPYQRISVGFFLGYWLLGITVFLTAFLLWGTYRGRESQHPVTDVWVGGKDSAEQDSFYPASLMNSNNSSTIEIKRIQTAFIGLVERLKTTQKAQRELLIARAEANKALAATIADRDREIAEQTAQLRQALSDAGDAAETKDRLLANTSHEMRTPLNGIIGRAELLLLQDLTEGQRADVRTIMQCADGLLQLINDLLDLTRLRGHMMNIANERFDLRDVIATVTAVMRPLAEQRGLRLIQILPEDLQPYWMGDALRLRQVILNLAGNAIKFTEFGEVRLSVSEASGGRLRITIEDTGIGIAQADLERIFDPFVQVDSGNTRASQGSGLGLAISRQLVELMGGTLSVDSTQGRGSIFIVNLWLEPAKEVGLIVKPEISKPNALAQLQVLVVDDVDINRDVLVSQLATLGITADSAHDGYDALEKITQRNYDLVLLDCQMPGIDGYEVAGRIRKEYPNKEVKIVAVTAHALPTERQKCIDAGMDDYISKPVRLAELKNLLSSWVMPKDRPLTGEQMRYFEE